MAGLTLLSFKLSRRKCDWLEELRPWAHLFAALANDGVRVFLDGQPIIDHWQAAFTRYARGDFLVAQRFTDTHVKCHLGDLRNLHCRFVGKLFLQLSGNGFAINLL